MHSMIANISGMGSVADAGKFGLGAIAMVLVAWVVVTLGKPLIDKLPSVRRDLSPVMPSGSVAGVVADWEGRIHKCENSIGIIEERVSHIAKTLDDNASKMAKSIDEIRSDVKTLSTRLYEVLLNRE